MSDWHPKMVNGADFWISCQQLAFSSRVVKYIWHFGYSRLYISTKNGVQINQWQRKKLSLLSLASYFIAFSVLPAIQQRTKTQLFEEPYYTIGHSALKKGSSSFKKTSKLLPFARFAAFLFLKKRKKINFYPKIFF